MRGRGELKPSPMLRKPYTKEVWQKRCATPQIARVRRALLLQPHGAEDGALCRLALRFSLVGRLRLPGRPAALRQCVDAAFGEGVGIGVHRFLIFQVDLQDVRKVIPAQFLRPCEAP